MDTVALVLRVLLALGVILGMMWALTRVVRGRGVGGGVQLELVARTPLGRKSSVAVLRLDRTRGIVVGVTDHMVTVLAEVELAEPAESVEVRETLTLPVSGSTAQADAAAVGAVTSASALDMPASHPTSGGRLSGSILAPSTWKQAAYALREKTVRQ